MITNSNQIELRHLRYFATLAKALHFREAAEKLFISQPALSRQIQQLEAHLGYALFDRHNRKVELTAAGTTLALRLGEVFQLLEKSFEEAKLVHPFLW